MTDINTPGSTSSIALQFQKLHRMLDLLITMQNNCNTHAHNIILNLDSIITKTQNQRSPSPQTPIGVVSVNDDAFLVESDSVVISDDDNSALPPTPEVLDEDDDSEIPVEVVTIEDDKQQEKKGDTFVSHPCGENESHIPIALAMEDCLTHTLNWKHESKNMEDMGPVTSIFDDFSLNLVPTIDSGKMEIWAFPSPPPKPPDQSSHAILFHSSSTLSTQLLLPWMLMISQSYETLLLVPNIMSVPLTLILLLPQPLPPKPPDQSYLNRDSEKYLYSILLGKSLCACDCHSFVCIGLYMTHPLNAYSLFGNLLNWPDINWSIKNVEYSTDRSAPLLLGILFPCADCHALVVYEEMTRGFYLGFPFVSFLIEFSCHNMMYESGFVNIIEYIWPLDSYLLYGIMAEGWPRFHEKRGYTFLHTPIDEELNKVTGVDDDKYLIAIAEQPLCAYNLDDWIHPSQLPIKYARYSSCFCKEAGSHGRNTLGISCVHQFEKVEQFCLTSPNDNDTWDMHEEMLKNFEGLYQALNLPYQVASTVSSALNYAAARKHDQEVWFLSSSPRGIVQELSRPLLENSYPSSCHCYMSIFATLGIAILDFFKDNNFGSNLFFELNEDKKLTFYLVDPRKQFVNHFSSAADVGLLLQIIMQPISVFNLEGKVGLKEVGNVRVIGLIKIKRIISSIWRKGIG